MVTYLVGTDGVAASEAIAEYLAAEVDADDRVDVVNVLSSGADAEERRDGEAGLDYLTDRFGDQLSIDTRQISRGRPPTDELVARAEEIDADRIVVALRRHSRTERIIFGSVSHSLLQRVTRPIVLLPLQEYQPPEE